MRLEKPVSRALGYALELLDGLDLVDQERIAVLPASFLPALSKALSSYRTVFVLSPAEGPSPFGKWRAVKCGEVRLERELVLMPQEELAEYEELARVLSSYVSLRATSFVTVVADVRDGSLVLAYKLLKSMRKLGAAPHVFLVLNLDHRDLKGFDKANVASAVSGVAPFRRYTILPFSIRRTMEFARSAQVVDYVEECLSDLVKWLHGNPLRGTYVPLCFRLEPASAFRSVQRALDLVFFASTGLLELPLEKLSFGSVRVWRGLREEARALEERLGGRVGVEYVDGDRLDVAALAEFSLRDVVVEGANIISESASTREAAEVLASLKLSGTTAV